MNPILLIAEVLEKAADDIATNGLAKYKLENLVGQHCAIGALGHATGATFEDGDFSLDSPVDHLLIEAAAEALMPQIPKDVLPSSRQATGQKAWNRVVYWNNAPERTAEEVAEAMRMAAKDLRNEATP